MMRKIHLLWLTYCLLLISIIFLILGLIIYSHDHILSYIMCLTLSLIFCCATFIFYGIYLKSKDGYISIPDNKI